jgi:2,3-bisphosphoglycerate-independent phosphoglycerate mutase
MAQKGSSSAVQKSCIAFVLIDGVGDVSVPSLNDQTPLQFADVRFLDAVAGDGTLRSN